MLQVIDAFESQWRPRSRPQLACLQSKVELLLYGGAAGSLKSETLLVDAIRYRDNPHARSIIFRKTNPELQQLIQRSRELYSKCGATYNETKKIWTFPSGMLMRFGWAKRDEDIFQYQGDQYDFEGWDESTHHSEFRIRYMISRLRSPDPFLQERRRIRLATNPGNVGHKFHKHTFLGPTCPHCSVSDGTRIPGKVYRDATWLSDKKPVGMTTAFIPGNLSDHNLLGTDYEKQLESLPGFYAAALRLGCWEKFEGQYFDIFNELTMTISYVEFQKIRKPWWPLWTGTDYGFGMNTGGSIAASYLLTRSPATAEFPRGRVYFVDEFCAPRMLAENYAIEQKSRWHAPAQEVAPNYLSPDCWNQRGDGHTIADQMQQATGIMYEQASNDRVGGAMLLYTMLQRGELVICRETCPGLIESIKSRIHDPDRPEDVLKVSGDPDDDRYDGARYGVYSYINAPERPREERIAEKVTSADPTMAALQRRMAEVEIGREDQPVAYTDFRRVRGY
jgi:hypothetical protein